MRLAPLAAVGAAAAVLAASAPAAAFVRYLTDDNAPFFWDQESVPITAYINDFTQTSMTSDQVTNAVMQAAAQWSASTNSCTYLQLVAASSTAKTPLAVNDGHNSIIFRNSMWCHIAADGKCDVSYDGSALAVTTDTANTKTGQIYDSDMEINLVIYQWADVVEDPNLVADMDLQNALTHEMGHLIGLDHTCYDPLTSRNGVRPDDNTGTPIPDCSTADAEVQATTMFPSANAGDTGKRTLAPDDQNAVCTIYNVNDPPPPPTDVNGGCVRCATAGRDADLGGLLALCPLAALILVRRRPRPGVRGR
jgi:hypothetical protein